MPAAHQNAIFLRRIRKLQGQLSKEKVDGLLVSNPINVRYLTGFISSAAQVIVSGKACVLMTDFRYLEAAVKQLPFIDVFQTTAGPKVDLQSLLRKHRVRRLGFETNHVSYQRYLQLKGYISEKRLKPRPDIIERLRMIKGPEEIAAIRKAIRLNEKGFKYIRKLLKPGVTEREIALELDTFLMASGGEKLAFEPIIAFGSGSAVPHHHTGRRKLRERDMVLIDWGVCVDGYSSDLTRTLLSHSMTVKEKTIYSIVLEAQKKAINMIKPGVPLAGIDSTARDHITKHGYGEAFGHSL